MTNPSKDNATHIKNAIFAVQQLCGHEEWSEWAKNWHPNQHEEGAICAKLMATTASQVKGSDGQWRSRVELDLASAVASVAETYSAATKRYCYTVHPSFPVGGQGYFLAMDGIARRCASIIARAQELASDNPPLYHGEVFRDKIGPFATTERAHRQAG